MVLGVLSILVTKKELLALELVLVLVADVLLKKELLVLEKEVALKPVESVLLYANVLLK